MTAHASESDIVVERLTTYNSADAAGIGRLLPALSNRLSDQPIPEDLLAEIIQSPVHEQLVARQDKLIVGAATLSLIYSVADGARAHLEDLVVDPTVRGHGIGSLLWDEIIRWCTEHQADLVFMSKPSRVEAHEFYFNHGAVIRETTVFHVDTHSN